MKLTSVKVRYQNSDIQAELSEYGEHFKKGIFQFASKVPHNYIELRDNKTTSFMESFYQRLSKILVSVFHVLEISGVTVPLKRNYFLAC